MIIGDDVHGEFGGEKSWICYESVYDSWEIPMIADRTASPQSLYRTKIMHFDYIGAEIVEEFFVKSFGCAGQNETKVDGSGRWVNVGQMIPHNIKPTLRGFWGRQ